MMFSSFGDQARTFMLSRQNAQLKTEMDRLSLELSSGRVADTSKAVRGDFTGLSEIEEAAASLGAYKTANSEAALFVENAQSVLGFIQGLTGEAAPALLMASNTNNNELVDATTSDTKQKFESVVSALNTQTTGRALFSGRATDTAALASVDDMLADLTPLLATETTAAGALTVIDSWFDDAGGGFETIGYTGSQTTLSPFKIGPGREAHFEITAADPGIRGVLKGLAIAALISEGTMSAFASERQILLQSAGEALLSNENEISGLRAATGTAEAHIDEMRVQNETEIHALDLARTRVLGADPYTAATELEAVQIQLETLYTVTARLSRLNLVDFLR
ncbi:flagellin [Falsihalocynthiibacter sp. S25ZX9]|uniref:flagellin n=1 Tax=Falsihalocynthiibacter sp. S25ZX9 TaxID=3240870 RepID=UPI00350F6B85